MKRKLKRWAILCLSLVLTFCLALPVWAEPTQTYTITPDQTGNITLTLGTDETQTVTATAYKVIDVDYNYASTDGYEAPSNPEFYWVTQVRTWVVDSYFGYIIQNNLSTNGAVNENFFTLSAENLKTFTDSMAVAIRNNTINNLAAAKTATGATSITLSGLEMGSYLILLEGGTKIYAPVFVSILPKWNGNDWVLENLTENVNTKAQSLSLTKTVFDKSTDLEPIDYEEGGSEQAQVAIGDTVTYMLVADVPSYPAKATATGYHISDSLPNGMTLNKDSIKVYGVTTDETTTTNTNLTATTDYTLSLSNATRPVTSTPTVSFNLAFNYNSIKSYSKIRVVYTATANAYINVIGQNGNTDGNRNIAYLDYNNNPYETAPNLSWKTAQDSATVYTYGIDISKVDAADAKQLPGAEFTLSRDGITPASPISFVGTTGSYRVALASEGSTSTTTTLVAADNGELKISGLDVGDYTLTETKAPAGYVKPSTPVTVTIADQNDGTPNGKPEYTPTGSNSSKEANDGYVPLTVKNHTGFTLPSTGGMGTVLFTTFGIVLMGGGFVLLLVYLRRRNRAK